MINERELAINPIVQESVQHNTQVKLPFPTLSLAPAQLTKHIIFTDNLQHPLPNRLPIRRRLRNPRPRIISRLFILSRRKPPRFCPHLRLLSGKATEKIFQ